MTGLPRREYLRATVATGVVGIAGCGGNGGGGDGENCSPLPDEPNYGGWFSNVSNYHRTCDRRGVGLVEVTVGAQGNNAFWAFAPPAIAVTPGTTVRWLWNGKGGPHNVVETRGVFDSGRPVEGANNQFEYTFQSPGVFRYACEPHESAGMKGAVFVAIE